MLNEGQNNKAALKIVFLAGGIGSGKTYIAEKLFGIAPGSSFSADGLKLVSFDRIYELFLKQHGIDPSTLSSQPPEVIKKATDQHDPNSYYSQCRNILRKQFSHLIKEGHGIIWDGSGRNGYLDKQKFAENMGYDTYCLYVDTSLNTALARNASRARKLPESVVSRNHRDVKAQAKWFAQDFKDNFMVVENDEMAPPVSPKVLHKIHEIANSPVKNKKGQYFLKTGKRPWLNKPKPDNAPQTGGQKSSGGQGNLFGHSPQLQPKPIENSENIYMKDRKILNPETGNMIFLRTALHYPHDHPMKKKAEAERTRIWAELNKKNPPF